MIRLAALDKESGHLNAYNETKGKRFEVLDRLGPERAQDLVLAGMKKFRVAGRSKKKREK